MMRLKYLLLLPCLLFPYMLLLALACVFLNGANAVMETIFAGNILYLLAAMLGYFLLTLACTGVYVVLALRQRWDAVAVARANMIVKLAQIPAYVAIFVLGVLFLITIFTMGFSLFFVFYDGLSIMLTGLVGIVAVWRGRQTERRAHGVPFWGFMGIAQFLFCLDVVAAVCLYRQVKRETQAEPTGE